MIFRFTEHKTDFSEIPSERPILIPCRQPGCRCVSFEYVANASATSDPNCRCKHGLDHHATRPPYKCQKSIWIFEKYCKRKTSFTYSIDCNCNGFSAPFTCSCGEPAYRHRTVVETKQERERRGHPTGYATPYKAMGGLTGFSSLAEGYLRLDPSGRGDSTMIYQREKFNRFFILFMIRTALRWFSQSTHHCNGSSDSSCSCSVGSSK